VWQHGDNKASVRREKLMTESNTCSETAKRDVVGARFTLEVGNRGAKSPATLGPHVNPVGEKH